MSRKPTERTLSGNAPLLREAAEACAQTYPDLARRLTEAALAESTPIKGLPVARFLAIVAPLLPTLALPVPEMRTKAWYGKVGKALRQSGLTTELAEELARKVAVWSTQDMPVMTLITRASEYLSARNPGVASPKNGLGARPMFDDGEPDE